MRWGKDGDRDEETEKGRGKTKTEKEEGGDKMVGGQTREKRRGRRSQR